VRQLGLIVIALALVGVGCGGEEPAPTTRTIRVPADQPTIQAAVDDAQPGDLILLSPGVYNESVTVETDRLVIRGLDRNEVVLDGDDRFENGIMVLADGVAVENLTIHSYRGNGVLFTGDYARDVVLRGYRVSYVTAYNNGLYGVYAFGARGGLIEHTYASGHPDAGIYIGQCFPCDAVVRNVTAELNAVGYQGTNAGGDLWVVASRWQRNRVGIEPNSSDRERLAPQRGSVIAANLIADNSEPNAPRSTDAFGVGIAVAGGHANRIEGNVIRGHAGAGILLTAQEAYLPEGNRVLDNQLDGNGTDLAYVVPGGARADNCFARNRFTTSSPPDIEARLACTPEAQGGSGEPVLPVGPPGPDYRRLPRPPEQPQLPRAATAPARPASPRPPPVNLATLKVPA
jgi:hypothetical protein